MTPPRESLLAFLDKLDACIGEDRGPEHVVMLACPDWVLISQALRLAVAWLRLDMDAPESDSRAAAEHYVYRCSEAREAFFSAVEGSPDDPNP